MVLVQTVLNPVILSIVFGLEPFLSRKYTVMFLFLSVMSAESAIFSPKKPSKCRTYCCVPGCSSRAETNRNLSFHLWPKKGKIKTKVQDIFGHENLVDCHVEWTRRFKMGKPNSLSMKVCSKHFIRDDYHYLGKNSKTKRLKKTALPSKYLPETPKHGTIINKNLKERCKRNLFSDSREQDELEAGDKVYEECMKLLEDKVKDISLEESEEQKVEKIAENCFPREDVEFINTIDKEEILVTEKERDAFLLLHFSNNCFKQANLSEKNNNDKGVQVSTDQFQFSLASLINSDEILNTLTGIPSLKLLDALVNAAENVWPDRHNGKHVLTLRESIILTMLKIKQDLSYSMLCILFQKISRYTCSRVFNTTVLLLSTILTPIVLRFPTREEINDNIPLCFHDFKSTRIILDCTEIPIEKSKCLRCRIRCYSQYKSGFTLKFLVGVTPAGLISYISPAHGGRVSDQFLFLKSELLKQMISGTDGVMVAKGFLIESTCIKNDIELIRPPFMHDNQLTCEEAVKNRKIAATRVHIERVNQRIKIFKMLRHHFPWGLLDYVDHIFKIACALVNLSSPVLSEERF